MSGEGRSEATLRLRNQLPAFLQCCHAFGGYPVAQGQTSGVLWLGIGGFLLAVPGLTLSASLDVTYPAEMGHRYCVPSAYSYRFEDARPSCTDVAVAFVQGSQDVQVSLFEFHDQPF
jgi:hypothetical protein